MQLPLFGLELDSGDITQFERVSDAESYIESYDIATWRVFDAQGDLCSIEPAKPIPMVEISASAGEKAYKLIPAIEAFLACSSTAGLKEVAGLKVVLDLLRASQAAQ